MADETGAGAQPQARCCERRRRATESEDPAGRSVAAARGYFRRFIRAWYEHGHSRRPEAHRLNTACLPGDAVRLFLSRHQKSAGTGRLASEKGAERASLTCRQLCAFFEPAQRVGVRRHGRPRIPPGPPARAGARVQVATLVPLPRVSRA